MKLNNCTLRNIRKGRARALNYLSHCSSGPQYELICIQPIRDRAYSFAYSQSTAGDSTQSVLIERVATQEVSAVWSIAIDLHVKLAQKSSSSSSISINNGGYYDINNDPLLGTHILRIGMQEVRKI